MADNEAVQKVVDGVAEWLMEQSRLLDIDKMLYGICIQRADGARVDPRLVFTDMDWVDLEAEGTA